MNKIPEIGKVYAFYDDGKIGNNRQYLAMVTRVLPIDSKEVNVKINGYAITDEDYAQEEAEGRHQFLHPLIDYWKYSGNEIDWVFGKDTDFIVECAIPEYDDHLIYCARTLDGEWFSFEVQSSWQCGLLDVEGKNDEYLMAELKEKRDKNIL